MMTTRWDDVPVVKADSAGATEFPESGWGALLCWIAGPEDVVRVARVAGEVGVTRVEMVDGDSSVTWERPTTVEERDAIEDSVDEYLVQAALPPRPRGYRWFARPGAPDVATWSRALQNAVDSGGRPSDPRQVRELGERVGVELREE